MAYSIMNKRNNRYYNSIEVEIFEAEEFESTLKVRGYLVKDIKGILYIVIPQPNFDEDLDASIFEGPAFKIVRIKPDSITTI